MALCTAASLDDRSVPIGRAARDCAFSPPYDTPIRALRRGFLRGARARSEHKDLANRFAASETIESLVELFDLKPVAEQPVNWEASRAV